MALLIGISKSPHSLVGTPTKKGRERDTRPLKMAYKLTGRRSEGYRQRQTRDYWSVGRLEGHGRWLLVRRQVLGSPITSKPVSVAPHNNEQSKVEH